ncbi:hypothetical protein GCM10027317_20230 [Massilia agri]
MWPLRLSERQAQGRQWEQAALLYLKRRGLTMVEENFRCKGGEIDLIMRDGDTLVFVEVRQRADRTHGGAAASITPPRSAASCARPSSTCCVLPSPRPAASMSWLSMASRWNGCKM